MKKITFFATSVTYFKDRRLSYAKTRSLFGPAERAAQTVNTIGSIRKKVPGARILLIEMGLKRELPENIDRLADSYVYIGDNFFVRLACDSWFKGLGETVGLFFAKRHIVEERADFYFKINGRYFLNDNFDIKKWDPDKFNFLKIGTSVSSRLYGFPAGLFTKWRRALGLSLLPLLLNRSLEQTLYWFLPKKELNYIQGKIGIAGNIGPDGGFMEE